MAIPRSIAFAALGLMIVACNDSPGPAAATTPALIVAVDLDPAPGVVEIELYAEPGRVEFFAGVETEVLGYRDGGAPAGRVIVPGPLIEAERGERLVVHFHNRTDRPTTLHFHGLRLPATMDGNPMVSGAVLPGGDFDYEFDLLDAGTFWYHPHVDADEQVELGLQGPMRVLDRADPATSSDRVFVLDDLDLDGAGRIVLAASEDDRMLGREGDVILVNGRPPATTIVPSGARERWRFINSANGRHFRLSLGGRAMTVIAWDGGRVEAPYVVEDLLIAPGERYELLIEFDDEPGARWRLDTLEVDRGEGRFDIGPRELMTIELGPSDPSAPSPEAGAFGRPLAMLELGPSTPTRAFVLEETIDPVVGPLFAINGQRWPFNTPLEVELGAVDVWAVENSSEGSHPFHVHGLFFEVLDIDGVPPPTRGRKDTVAIPGKATARLALQYGEPGSWMFHCSILEHAEGGMMGEVMVSEP